MNNEQTSCNTAQDSGDFSFLSLIKKAMEKKVLLFFHPASPDTMCWTFPDLIQQKREIHFLQLFDLDTSRERVCQNLVLTGSKIADICHFFILADIEA